MEGDPDAELPAKWAAFWCIGLIDWEPDRVVLATINNYAKHSREWSVPSGLRPVESLAFRSWIER